ncbi:MAG: putative DNA-binding domain-containing protein [Lysobacter sp.]|nr:putative DNA-binding domain-containing protein [Lysobacter sp.]
MTPDAPPESPSFAERQNALGAYVRDPERVPPPPGIEPRRLKIYRELFFNNVESLLAGNFPVIHKIYGDKWPELIHDFYREHGCQTPLFTELPREFMRYLDTREAEGRDDPPWLRELAHYEWVELALQISEATIGDIAHDPDGDLLEGWPLLSPLAWPLAYAWPVHRIGPDHQPDAPPEGPTLLMLRREPDGKVSFHALTPLTFRLLQRLDAESSLSGRDHLRALAAEAGAEDVDRFVADGASQLIAYRRDGTILGTRSD